jgi:signal transduction histidine kinase
MPPSAKLDRVPRARAWTFALVVAVGLAQVAWWVYFQLAEAGRLERAGNLLARGDSAAAAIELGVGPDEDLAAMARRRRVMFISEGVTLSLLVLVGVVVFYIATERERRLRAAQERFLAGATHELKTPVASIRLGLESFRAGSLPEAKRSTYLDAMLREADRLEVGLGNLLAVADLRATATRPTPQPGDLAEDLRATLASLRERSATARVELHATAWPPTPVRRHAADLQRALANVLDNAIKFSPAGSRVDIDLAQQGTDAIVTVRDRGIGIRADDLPHLGERFYRGANAQHRGGTGLGLHLASELLARAGGRLDVHSDGEGHGTCVTLRLPLAADAPNSSAARGSTR